MSKSDNPGSTFLSSTTLAASNKSPEQKDLFWVHESIDAARWNQVFPYQLLVVKKGADGKYFQESSSDPNQSKNWVFTLPFPPESLSISMPFAITGSVTQGGYVEEHGGAPIRTITLSGSLGVLPLRPAAAQRAQQNLAQAIFGGTITQVGRIASSAQNLASNVTGNNTNNQANLVDKSVFLNAAPGQDADNVATTSGYYQLRVLQQFLENYVSFKKSAKGADYRLALCLWKQQAVYLVTPLAFSSNANSGSPYEHLYQLSFKAFRRISLDNVSASAANQYTPTAFQPNGLQKMLKTITDARAVLENSRDVFAAVGGDLDTALFEPVRQIGMFLRDALSVPLAFSDLPVSVLQNCQSAIIQYVSTTGAYQNAGTLFANKSQKVTDAATALARLGSATSKVDTQSGQLVLVQADPYATDPALSIFKNPGDNYDFFSQLQPSQVNLSPVAIRAIMRERLAIRSLKRLDFEKMRDNLVQVQADFADAVGAGNATYNTTYNRTVRATSKTPTDSDFSSMFALNRVIMEFNRFAASGQASNQPSFTSLDYVAGLASASGIAFTTPKSKFAVPYPYGVTLEQLAQRYLGDPDRWIEIAALNGLRAPYVDEQGFDLTLLTNGRGNQVSVADTSNLHIGQQVWISAATTSRTMRRITNIVVYTNDSSVVTVDGDADLDRFSTLAGATLHAFLPDTVNSQMMLYMPSDVESTVDDYDMKAVPGLDVYDQLLNVGGYDLLLTPTNDLAVTPDGDCRLAVGLANIVQTARIRLGVYQGSLNRHPTFGLPIKPGISVADLTASQLLIAAQNLFNDDPVFTGVTSASVQIGGPTASIALSVSIRGQASVIPITLNVPR